MLTVVVVVVDGGGSGDVEVSALVVSLETWQCAGRNLNRKNVMRNAQKKIV